MYRSSDGKFHVAVIKSLGDIVYPAADITIANIPKNPKEASEFFKNLYNTPSKRHLLMLFNRHSRDTKRESLANLQLSKQWKFLDMVHIWYEKPSSSSNIGFLPVVEEAFLLYKGQVPNVKNTEWFSQDWPNATNLWPVTPSTDEAKVNTYYRKFSWETVLLLATMMEPMEVRRINYFLSTDHDSVIKFCKKYNMMAHFFVKNHDELKKISTSLES